jgi:hypothetical protein
MYIGILDPEKNYSVSRRVEKTCRYSMYIGILDPEKNYSGSRRAEKTYRYSI